MLSKFYEKIGIIDQGNQEGISIFWTIVASILVTAIFVLLIIKFGIWLYA